MIIINIIIICICRPDTDVITNADGPIKGSTGRSRKRKADVAVVSLLVCPFNYSHLCVLLLTVNGFYIFITILSFESFSIY